MGTESVAVKAPAPGKASSSCARRRSAGREGNGPAQHSAEVKALLQASGSGPTALQAKLRVGAVDDPFEREADRVADRVLAGQAVPELAGYAQSASASPPAKSPQPVNPAAPAPSPSSTGRVTPTKAVDTSGPSPDLQRRCSECEEELQRKPDDEERLGSVSVGQQAANAIAAIRRGGRPLADRAFFESRFGLGFEQVRVHTDGAANALAKELGARAFTHGNHIVFGAGEYAPGSHRGRHLIAHELTHVVQQGASATATPQVQRAEGDDDPAPLEDVAGDKRTGLVNRPQHTITWSKISLPKFKYRGHRRDQYNAFIGRGGLKRGRGRRVDRTGDNNPAQRSVWLAQRETRTAIRDELESKLRAANAGELPEGNEHVFEVRAARGNNRYYHGTLDQLASEFMIPTWGGTGRQGTATFFHVDHIVELQLANWPHDEAGNDLSNMELLEGRINQQSGQDVKTAILGKIDDFIEATDGAYGETAEEIKENYTLVFEGADGRGSDARANRADYWEASEIADLDHLNAVAAADPTKIGGPGLVRIFSRPNGGVSRAFTWSGNTEAEQEVPSRLDSERYWLKPFVITHKYFKTDPEGEASGPDFGYLRMHVSQRSEVFDSTEPFDLPLSRFVGARYGGSLPDTIRTTINNLDAKFFSPVSWDQLEIFGDRGIVATGNIHVSLPFFSEGTDIGLRLENGDLEVFKEFSLEEIDLPAPFSVSECSLRLAYGLENGWAASGQVAFAIDGVGEGQVVASVGKEQGFSASGEFNFESTLFNPARLEVGYTNGNWSFGGEVGFESGTIPGLDSGNLTVRWENDVLSGTGNIAFTYPWLDSGTLEFSQSAEEGFSLGAEIGLTDAVPGLRSGNVGVRVSKNPEGEWSLGGSIRGDLDTSRIPGFSSAVLRGEIQDGIFDASLETEFARDIASGDVTVGVTNQALDENGQVLAGQATDALVFYGQGNVTLQLTPWLAASAGIQFDRDGGVSVRGGVEVTEDIEILTNQQTPDLDVPEDRRPSFDVDIPLVNVGVADVELELTGSLNAYVHTSPLTLKDVGLDVFYDFDDPSATRVSGDARLHMDAQAGLSGSLGLGLSARVLVLRGGGRITLTVGAELDGRIDLAVHPSWSVSDGFAVSGELDAVVQPVVFVSLTGNLYAEIDALLGSIEVWESDDLDIADERVPLDIRVGATAEASYRQKPASELTYSGINWIVPTADQMEDALIKLVRDKV